MSSLYADVAFPLGVDKLFTYSVPPELQQSVQKGVRVSAPFGNRTLTGIIVNLHPTTQVPNLKSISDILDVEPIIFEELLQLAQWIAEYYFAPVGEVLKAVLVQGATRSGKRLVTVTVTDPDTALREVSSSKIQTSLLKELLKHGSLSTTQLQKKLGKKNIHSGLNGLQERGYVTITDEAPDHKEKPKFEKVIHIDDASRQNWNTWLTENTTRAGSKQRALIAELVKINVNEQTITVLELLKRSNSSTSSLQSLVKKHILTISQREVIRKSEYDQYDSFPTGNNIILNPHQQTAVDAIGTRLQQQAFHSFLLYGITGSGKTQVYIEAIRKVLDLGKTAIVLVPEISLTPQIVRRFKSHFGEKVAVLHSRMSHGERYDAWRLTKEGKYSIVIGPRSAVFAPLKNLGLIVVDEEHEPSYKQFDQMPRYHARDVAIMRSNECNAVVVLGSATPSLESYSNALSGKFTLIELPERVDNAKLPQIDIVDMASERKKKLALHKIMRKAEFKTDPVKAIEQKHPFEFGIISDLLKEKIEDRLKKNEGIILLQNRRGFSPFIECPECGHVEMCDNCNISLTYHATKRHLRCHYCGQVKQPPEVCPECASPDIQYRGFGTQRVEEELEKMFPSATTIRMDLDTTTQRGSHDAILRKFSDGKADILLGTQMVAKGLDFSRVTLVGVISAETQMLLPDFRSSERTFQLLTQVAGRAGRSTLAGEVVIQTYMPQHNCFQHVVTHNFKSFYEQELEYRKELDYPPFSRIVLIEFKGKNESETMRHADLFAGIVKKHNSFFTLLGPSPASLTKLRGQYRWHIVIKNLKTNDPSGQRLHRALKKVIADYQTSPLGKSKSVSLLIDIDPVGMM